MNGFRWAILLLSILVFVSATACSSGDSESSPVNPTTDGDEEPLPDGDDEQGGEGAEGGEDVDDVEDVEGSGQACLFPQDCTELEDCRDEVCVGAKRCVTANDDCDPTTEVCWRPSRDADYGRCRLFCTTDMDCPPSGQCMNGLCEAYNPVPEGTPPAAHPEWDGQLHANYAEGALYFPMTTTLGGYGARKGPQGPYQEAMGASHGIWDRPIVKVLTLDDGEDRIVFIRLPMIFSTDFLLNGVVKRVMEMEGNLDLSENIVASATHSHSGPARFWNILPDLSFGALGLGEFDWEIYSYLVDSIAKVVWEANQEEGFRRASFGYAINEDFDPEDRINRDRRPENDDFKDKRLVVWRVDDLSGDAPKPWIVTLAYATHGTIGPHAMSWITNDSGGGAENMVQLLWEKEHPGERINSIFFQGSAGDVSPAGGDLGHDYTAQMQMVGARVYPKVMELYNAIEPKDDIDLKIISKRLPIDRDYIGYRDNEFYSDGVSSGEFPPGGPFTFGAFQCGLLKTVVEENLDVFLYDASMELLDDATLPRKDTEKVRATIEATGTYYFKVIGPNGTMNDYSLFVETREAKRSSAPCIDAQCGQPCGSCPQTKTALAPVECDEDDIEENDSKDAAYAVEVGTLYENLQVCPNDEDWFKVELNAGEKVTITVEMGELNTSAYNPNSKLQDGNLGCALTVDKINTGPLPQFSKTRLTAVKLGGLYLAGLPGESLSHLADDTIKDLEADPAIAAKFDDVMLFGYCNDHHFYLQTPEDWFQGGYETTMSIWGFQFGPFLLNALKDLAIAFAEGRETEAANEYPQVKPLTFQNVEEPYRVPEVTPMPTEASIVKQPSDTIKMQERASFRWIGGDPGADLPNIYLEREVDGEFVQVYRPSGRVYNDRYYEMKLAFENEHFALPNKEDADPNNYWEVTWEESFDFPSGVYRFRVEGHYYDGASDLFDGVTGKEPYTLHSAPFELLPVAMDVQYPTIEAGMLSASVRYAKPVEEPQLLHDSTCEVYVGPRAVADADVTNVTITIGETTITEVTWAQTNGQVEYINEEGAKAELPNRPISRFTADLAGIPAGTYDATIAVSDKWGNQGEEVFTLTIE